MQSYSYLYKSFCKWCRNNIDVGVNAPGMKMSKKKQKINEFIKKVDGFKSMKILIKNESAEFTMLNGSKKIVKF